MPTAHHDAIDLQHLKKWFDMTWDPVGAKLSSHGPYQQDFLPAHQRRAMLASAAGDVFAADGLLRYAIWIAFRLLLRAAIFMLVA
jgi:hypothetical protein